MGKSGSLKCENWIGCEGSKTSRVGSFPGRGGYPGIGAIETDRFGVRLIASWPQGPGMILQKHQHLACYPTRKSRPTRNQSPARSSQKTSDAYVWLCVPTAITWSEEDVTPNPCRAYGPSKWAEGGQHRPRSRSTWVQTKRAISRTSARHQERIFCRERALGGAPKGDHPRTVIGDRRDDKRWRRRSREDSAEESAPVRLTTIFFKLVLYQYLE